MYRNPTYDADLAKELQKKSFAQGFILDLMEGEEGLSLEEALRVTIQSMGVSEYCERTQMSKQQVQAFLSSRRIPKPNTLNALLHPFGLRVRMTVEKAS